VKALFAKAEEKGTEYIFWFMHIYEFREGNYNSASDKCKEAWYLFCHNILIHINRRWKKQEYRKNRLLSATCNISDEAYGYMIGCTNMYFWMQKYYSNNTNKTLPFAEISPIPPHTDCTMDMENQVEDEEEEEEEDNENQEEQGPGVKNKKFEKDNKLEKEKGKDRIEMYYKFYRKLQKKKQENLEDWNSWEVAYKNFITSSSNVDDSIQLDVQETYGMKRNDIYDDIVFEEI
jgi:hypothetical protein